MDDKRFDEWNVEKQRLHNFGRLPDIKKGEIWWCSMGENIGVFIGVPLTSQFHEGTWYVHFKFRNRNEV